MDEHAPNQLVLSEGRELPDDGVKIVGTEVVDEAARVDLAMEREDGWDETRVWSWVSRVWW
jgi:hypothetical protein